MKIYKKTFSKNFRGRISVVTLIAIVLVLTVFIGKEDKLSQQTTAIIENNQQLGKKVKEGDNPDRGGRKVSQQNAKDEKSAKPLENKNIDYTKGATILMYHYIHEFKENHLCMPREKFREQMRYLKENGYNIISLDELYSYYADGTPIPDNAVVITFDDGYDDNYYFAYPILKEMGFKATIFVITSKIDQPLYLSTAQLKELDKSGMSIESHTVNHPELVKLSYNEQLFELSRSKTALESILGKNIKYLSYPFGGYNTDTVRIAEDLNYKMGFATVPEKAKKSNGIYTQNRINVGGPIDIEKFKQLLNKK